MKQLTEEINSVKKDLKTKIYYLIFDEHAKSKQEIISNYNIGLITFIETLTQIKELHEITLKRFKENDINENDLFN